MLAGYESVLKTSDLSTQVNSLQESWYRPPSSLSLGGRLSKVWPARLLLPALFLFFSLSFYFIHLQTRWTTNRNGNSTVTATSFLSTLARIRLASCLGISLRVYRHSVNYNLTEGTPVAKGIPEEANAIGDSRKTTETEARSSLATVDACTVPGGRFPANLEANQWN